MISRQNIIDVAVMLTETLHQRGKTHGVAGANFETSADLFNIAFGERKWDALDIVLAYELLKIARIIEGDRLEPDHWRDTAGYAVIGTAFAEAMKRADPVVDYNPEQERARAEDFARLRAGLKHPQQE